MLTIKTSLAIVILIGGMGLASLVTILLLLNRSQECQPVAMSSNFHREIHFSTTDGKRY